MRAVVVLSGGLDSAYNLAKAAREGAAHFALSFDYGQRAAVQELQAAEALSRHYKIEWRSLNLSWLGAISTSALTRPAQELPLLQLHQLDNLSLAQASKARVWVPNRNGVFFNIAAAFAEAQGCDTVLAGFNAEEAVTFPDNSVDYLQQLTRCFSFSTQNGVRVDSFCKNMTKTQVIADALELRLPLDLVWSCYEAGPKRCWRCESCKRTERALRENGSAGMQWLQRLEGPLEGSA